MNRSALIVVFLHGYSVRVVAIHLLHNHREEQHLNLSCPLGALNFRFPLQIITEKRSI